MDNVLIVSLLSADTKEELVRKQERLLKVIPKNIKFCKVNTREQNKQILDASGKPFTKTTYLTQVKYYVKKQQEKEIAN